MKRFLMCLVVLIAVAALVAPAYAVESTFGGLWRVRAFSYDNANDGNDNNDDNINGVDNRFRLYYFGTASENLRVVFRMEVNTTWGAAASGGDVGADSANLLLKNSYIEFNVPGAPIRAKIGQQGITLHRGWFVADDFSAVRFDFNFDPASLALGWNYNESDTTALAQTDSSDDSWQFWVTGDYKQEMWGGRLSLAYQRNANDSASSPSNIKEDAVWLLMGDLTAGGDAWSAFLTAGINFGDRDKITPTAADPNASYNGYMVDLGGTYMFDPVSVNAKFFYVSGQELDEATGLAKEPKDIDFFGYLDGRSMYWSELLGLGTIDKAGGYDAPNNTMAFNIGVSGKATDTTDISLQYWYIAAVEDVLASGTPGVDAKYETGVGSEIDLKITQTIYEGFKAYLVGAYVFADDGFTGWAQQNQALDGQTPTATLAAGQTPDDAYELGLMLQYTW